MPDRLAEKIQEGVRYQASLRVKEQIGNGIAAKRAATRDDSEASKAVKRSKVTYIVDSGHPWVQARSSRKTSYFLLTMIDISVITDQISTTIQILPVAIWIMNRTCSKHSCSCNVNTITVILQYCWKLFPIFWILYSVFFEPVLQIHDNLVWFRIRMRIRGSIPLTNGSQSGCGSGSWTTPNCHGFSSITFTIPT